MRRFVRSILIRSILIVVALATADGKAAGIGAGESDAYSWLQYGADGHPHVRVIPSDRAACPTVTADGLGISMSIAVVAAPGFDRILCDAELPRAARLVAVAGQPLPLLPRRINRFIVLGNTGCRITITELQNCRDAAAWPFARIAASIAHDLPRPDLIVHLGDYVQREVPCPAGDARCAGSPFGDTWDSWAVDLFEPGAPLFATAPIVWVRGSREQCARNGSGWSRYLAPLAESDCREHDDPVTLTFDDLRLVAIDSAVGDQRLPDAADTHAPTIVLTHRVPLAELAAAHAAEPADADRTAIITGQLDVFAAVPFAAAPPTIIVGTGGASLAPAAAAALSSTFRAVAEARFGYAVFDRVADGWTMSERDPDGAEHRRCEFHARTVHC
jgi:hypothetical protein